MKTIYKFPLSLNPFTIRLSVDSKVTHCGEQNGKRFVWIETVDVKKIQPGQLVTTIEKTFEIFGTGMDIPASAVHQATWQDGEFVWHLYQLVK